MKLLNSEVRHKMRESRKLTVLISIPFLIVNLHGADRANSISMLVSGRPIEQQQAISDLSKMGPVVAPSLCDVIEREKDPMAKVRASKALEEIVKEPINQNQEILIRLHQMAKSEDDQVIRLAMKSLMHISNRLSREVIRDVALKHANPEVRAEALSAFIVNINGDQSEVPFIEKFLSDPSEYVQVAAAGSLGKFGNSKGLKICNDILNRPPDNDMTRALQMRAAIAIGRIGDLRSIPLLRKISSSEAYGIAQSDAFIAIKEIELKNCLDEAARIAYLKTALTHMESVRWAVQNLMRLHTSEALATLQWAASQKDIAGSFEAKRGLAVMEAGN